VASALLAHFRPDWKGLPWTNALAYQVNGEEESFITWTTGYLGVQGPDI